MKILAPILVVALLLLAPAGADAVYDPVGGGKTTIKLDPSFRALLAQNGVKLLGKGGVRVNGARITFPVSGGRLDPTSVRGTVDHSGSLVFSASGRTLPMRGLILRPSQDRSPLSAKFGGGKLKVSSSARLSTARAGFGLKANVAAMKLSAKAAVRLTKKLGLRGVFQGGQPLGSAVTVAQPASVAVLAAGRATLTPDPVFMAKLDELFVSLNPISPAERAPGPLFTLPIAGGGSLAPDASSGTLKLVGALEFLQLGAGQIFWNEPVFELGTHLADAEVDLQPSPPYPGKRGLIPIFDLTAAATVTPEPTPRRISVGGVLLSLNAETATAFNEAFGKPQGRDDAFHAGEAFGTLTFTAQTQ